MNIILGQENVVDLDGRYLVLELDTFVLAGRTDPITAFCVLEQPSLSEMFKLPEFLELHQNLVSNYKKQNWDYCKQAIEHLRGHWRGQVDSFYDDITQRIEQYQTNPPAPDWTGIINKSSSQSTATFAQ